MSVHLLTRPVWDRAGSLCSNHFSQVRAPPTPGRGRTSDTGRQAKICCLMSNIISGRRRRAVATLIHRQIALIYILAARQRQTQLSWLFFDVALSVVVVHRVTSCAGQRTVVLLAACNTRHWSDPVVNLSPSCKSTGLHVIRADAIRDNVFKETDSSVWTVPRGRPTFSLPCSVTVRFMVWDGGNIREGKCLGGNVRQVSHGTKKWKNKEN